MKTDPKNIIQQAFQDLEVFSIPGVGTFRRSYFPAHIDRETNTIYPPGERFVLEKGEQFVDKLEGFLARSHDFGQKAEIKVQTNISEVKIWLVRELKAGKKLIFPGVGSLELKKGKEVGFEADLSQESQLGNFFGLLPLGFTLDEPLEQDGMSEEHQEKTIAASTQADILDGGEPEYVNPGEPEPPREKRDRTWIWVILLLLFFGTGTVGVFMREQVRDQLESWGLISDVEDIDSGETVGGYGTGGVGLAGNITDSSTVGGVSSGGDHVDGDGNYKHADDWKNVEAIEPLKRIENIGSFPESGVYYLVIASAKDPSSAKSMGNKMGGNVIRPRSQGNYYRVYSYKSKDKKKVIAKMVEFKDKYPRSWIYWVGM